jgi:membrane-associated protease RseP (regulator of RpoE activity)
LDQRLPTLPGPPGFPEDRWAAPSPLPDDPLKTRWWLHLALFAATFLTAAMAGGSFWEGRLELNSLRDLSRLFDTRLLAAGLPYAALLLAILTAHEMGHYLACRRYGVPATLPFFIPGIPLPIGTFGAVIRIRGVIPTRKALFDIAAAGPIAGFLVAVPVLVVGVVRAVEVSPAAGQPGGWLGPPLLSVVLERLVHGSADIRINGIYGAAWVGMLVTSMNLFPVGQLDGGHAVFALSPRAHRVFSWATIAALAVLVVGEMAELRTLSAYTLWLGILLLLRDRHPRLANEGEPLSTGRRIVAAALALIFVLSFIPVPIVLG